MIHQTVFMVLLQTVHVGFLQTLIACRTDYNTKEVTDQSNYAVRDVWAGKGSGHTAHKKSLYVKDMATFSRDHQIHRMYMCAWRPVTSNRKLDDRLYKLHINARC